MQTNAWYWKGNYSASINIKEITKISKLKLRSKENKQKRHLICWKMGNEGATACIQVMKLVLPFSWIKFVGFESVVMKLLFMFSSPFCIIQASIPYYPCCNTIK